MNLKKSKAKYIYFRGNRNTFLGFSVNAVGFQSIPPNTSYPSKDQYESYSPKTKKGNIASEYKLIYITKGTGVLKEESSGAMYICAGQMILIRSDQCHFYSPNQELGWDKYYVEFCNVFFDNTLRHSISIIENRIITIGFNAELVNLFRRAIEVLNIDNTPFQEHLQGIVIHIIGLVITESQRKNKTNEYSQQIVEKAKIIMSENLFSFLSPVELARELDINYVTFRKLFKETTGLAPAKYLMTLKMQKAKEILANSSLSINKISNNLGFDSQDSFNKAFKKSTGQTGTKYRLNSRSTSG